MKEDMDLHLSEEVAKQAGERITNLQHTVEENKDLQNSILRDFVSDTRTANKFIKKICIALLILLFFTIGGAIGMSIYNQHLIKKTSDDCNQQMLDFMMNTTFETTIDMTTDNNSENSGNISVDK